MTVQELLDHLQKLDDKTAEIYVFIGNKKHLITKADGEILTAIRWGIH